MSNSSPQDENNEPARNSAERQQISLRSEKPVTPAKNAVDSGPVAAGEREPEEGDIGPVAETETESRAINLARAAAAYLLVAFGAVFVPYLLWLIAEQSYISFFADVAPGLKSEAKGNIGTLTIALSAVLGVLDWTFTNRQLR